MPGRREVSAGKSPVGLRSTPCFPNFFGRRIIGFHLIFLFIYFFHLLLSPMELESWQTHFGQLLSG